jgi:hypothetical protein
VGADWRRARTAAGLSRDAPLHRHVPWACLDRLGPPPRCGLIAPVSAHHVVATHHGGVLKVGAGGDRGVHPLPPPVAPHRSPCREEGTERNAGGADDVERASNTACASSSVQSVAL